MSDQMALFPSDTPEQEPPFQILGKAAQLTIRQAKLIAAGIHPANQLPLSPQAAPAGDRNAPGQRCGGCSHMVKKRQGNGEWLKCDLAGNLKGPDARAWWPACNRYTPTGGD